jgi:hypothetical protein
LGREHREGAVPGLGRASGGSIHTKGARELEEGRACVPKSSLPATVRLGVWQKLAVHLGAGMGVGKGLSH